MKLFEDGDPLFAPQLNALFAAFRGTAVMSGCAQSATGANRNVTVAAGSVQIGGATVAVAGGTVTPDTGGEFDRYDLVTVDAAGALAVTKGAVTRKCPAQPADTCLIAIVFVPAGATVIATGNVYDARMDALRLSVLNIDADKDWNGKGITNLRCIDAILIRPVASDQVRYGPKPGSMTVTVPAVYGPGTAKITGNVSFYWSDDTGYPGYMVIKVNSVTVATVTAPDTGNHTLTKIIQITGGDVINVTGVTLNSSSLSLDDTAPISYPPSPTWPE